MKKFLVLTMAVLFVLSFTAFASAQMVKEKGAAVVTPQKGGDVTVAPPAKQLEKPAAVKQTPTKDQTAKSLKAKQTKEANDLKIKQTKEAKDLKAKLAKEAKDLKAKQVKEAADLKAKK